MKGKNKEFFSYVIPSVLAFALSGVYTIVDGFFIGQSLGDMGLAAITLGYPVSALVGAVGTGIVTRLIWMRSSICPMQMQSENWLL